MIWLLVSGYYLPPGAERVAAGRLTFITAANNNSHMPYVS